MLKASTRNILRSTALAIVSSTILAGSAVAQTSINFEISDGRVVPSEAFAAKVSVLGAAITSGGRDMPVTVQFRIGDMVIEPFGSHSDPDAGNVNDHRGPRHFIIQETFDASEQIEVTATSWRTSGSKYLQRNSHEESPSVKVLRDGDDVPDITGFAEQADAVRFVQKYIDPETNTMHMDENQAIYLFELGTTRLSSSAADFQDAVVLVTLGESPEALDQAELMDTMYD